MAIEEMGHLAAVWNITCALGGSPRFGRSNFPLDPGYLPASVTVKLAPFNAETLQHFVFLERPQGSAEPDGEGFAYERPYVRGGPTARLTPMAIDYATVGDFYAALCDGLWRSSPSTARPMPLTGTPRCSCRRRRCSSPAHAR